MFDGPVYGTKLTLALVEPKLEEHGKDVRARLTEVRPRDRVQVGQLHDRVPARDAQHARLRGGGDPHAGRRRCCTRGISRSTRRRSTASTSTSSGSRSWARKASWCCSATARTSSGKGFSGSERDVIDGFEEIFTSARGRIVVAMFSSSLYRMQILVDLADQFERQAWRSSGAGVIENSQIALRLGYLRMPPGVQIRDSEIREFPSQDVVCICTGSQGEPQAALPRIAIDDHRHAKLDHDDVVVFSAREIPGNEKAIGRVMNHIAQRGADIIHEGIKHVHVSGHGSEEELKLMLSLIRPTLLRADTRGVPPARPARADRQDGLPGHEGGPRRKRRPHPVRRRRGARRREGRGGADPDRRHAERRGR